MSKFDYFDKISKQWVELDLNDEVGVFLKRSYWREDAQERRYYNRKLDFEDELDYESYLTTESCEELVVSKSVVLELYSALGTLDQADRLLVYLRYFRDLKLKEISVYVGLSEAQVSRKIKKICQVLRRELVDLM